MDGMVDWTVRPMQRGDLKAWERTAAGQWEALGFELSAVGYAYLVKTAPIAAAMVRAYNEAMRRVGRGHAQ